jgi:hypothetical protein
MRAPELILQKVLSCREETSEKSVMMKLYTDLSRTLSIPFKLRLLEPTLGPKMDQDLTAGDQMLLSKSETLERSDMMRLFTDSLRTS